MWMAELIESTNFPRWAQNPLFRAIGDGLEAVLLAVRQHSFYL